MIDIGCDEITIAVTYKWLKQPSLIMNRQSSSTALTETPSYQVVGTYRYYLIKNLTPPALFVNIITNCTI